MVGGRKKEGEGGMDVDGCILDALYCRVFRTVAQ